MKTLKKAVKKMMIIIIMMVAMMAMIAIMIIIIMMMRMRIENQHQVDRDQTVQPNKRYLQVT